MVDGTFVASSLLTSPLPRGAFASVNVWLDRLAELPASDPFERSVVAGFEADRLGYAFVGGYEAALARLVSGNSIVRRSLAATEAGGAHPRAIATRLEESESGYTLRGEKTFATLASVADELLVVASMGKGESGRNMLRIARVSAKAPNLAIVDRPAVAFAPELPHAIVKLDGVVVREEDLLPGDGYERYLKPFRTVEDVHVFAATLGYAVREARAHGFARALIEGASALLVALREVGLRPPSDAAGHIALAGLIMATRRLLAEHDGEWEKATADVRDRWRRDIGLMMVAETVRTKRTEAAWTALLAHAT
jgi:hypothetical protein